MSSQQFVWQRLLGGTSAGRSSSLSRRGVQLCTAVARPACGVAATLRGAGLGRIGLGCPRVFLNFRSGGLCRLIARRSRAIASLNFGRVLVQVGNLSGRARFLGVM